MKKSLILTVLTLILLTTLTSAAIQISEPYDVYNLGDKIYIDTILEPNSVSGFFEISLLCDKANESLTIEKFIANRFSTGEEQTTSTQFPLTPAYIKDYSGNCQIRVSIANEESLTKTFTITKDIRVTPTLDKVKYDPGETITLTIEAIKANSRPLNGFMEVSGAMSSSKAVENGIVTEQLSMNQESEPGTYTIDLFVYDRDENSEILNQANTSISFEIAQIPSWLDIPLSALEINPGEILTIGAEIYDQSGVEMEGSVSVTIISPEREENQKIVQTGDFISIDFPTNATPGTWEVYAQFQDILEKKEFQVNEFPKVEFEFINSILIIRNIGNCIYNKTINIKIGEETQELNLNMKMNEERRFNLKAPDGEYDVVVSDQETEIEQRLLLTGKVVSIINLGGLSFLKDYMVIWIFVILILAIIGVILFFRFRRSSTKLQNKIKKIPSKVSSGISKTLNFTNKSPDSQNLDGQEKEDKMLDLSKPKISRAESALVLKGEKQNSAVISVKIKNYKDLTKKTKKEIEETIRFAQKYKGLINLKEENILIVFSPLITRTFKNEILAVKTGSRILNKFQEQNRKFREKIEFGIGIHSGDLIASKEEDKLKYTSIGNTISLAKKLCTIGENQLFVSEQIRKKLIRDLKVEKAGTVGKTDIYLVKRITNTEANQEKLQEILKRMERD